MREKCCPLLPSAIYHVKALPGEFSPHAEPAVSFILHYLAPYLLKDNFLFFINYVASVFSYSGMDELRHSPGRLFSSFASPHVALCGIPVPARRSELLIKDPTCPASYPSLLSNQKQAILFFSSQSTVSGIFAFSINNELRYTLLKPPSC